MIRRDDLTAVMDALDTVEGEFQTVGRIEKASIVLSIETYIGPPPSGATATTLVKADWNSESDGWLLEVMPA